MKTLAAGCAGCNLCVKECAFLTKYGHPGKIAHDLSEGRLSGCIWSECSLCGLCTSLCPKDLDPCAAFRAMRSKEVASTGEVLPAYKGILAYEKRGLSQRYSFHELPEACTTVFFPGCTFAGTRAKRTEQIYEWLREKIPNTGIVLECCTKPSHDLGRDDFFTSHFSALEKVLLTHGVQTIITVCPNCYKVFSTYSQRLKTISIYEVLGEKSGPVDSLLSGCVTIHDPCVARFETGIHDSVRQLVKDQGLEIKEMAHSREKTICCGEGGSVFAVTPEFASTWRQRRIQEAGNDRIITYCAGCCAFLGKSVQTDHILDLFFEPEKTMAGAVKPTIPPFTYLARINLKRKCKKKNREEISGKNDCVVDVFSKRTCCRMLLLVFIAAAVIGIRMAGLDDLLTQENIHQAVADFGPLAPAAYILMVTLAPALFLPGAPFIIVGGVIFGPFWGVVYGMTGATLGASLAFLVARYVAAEWVESKLTHPAWIRLKTQTEKQGWKIVAFTRLVPLFPFNLLSYGLGLTRIKFTTYLVTSFICMLPGCIGYILLSSSLLDLLQGNLSLEFFAGLGLIALLSVVPALFKS